MPRWNNNWNVPHAIGYYIMATKNRFRLGFPRCLKQCLAAILDVKLQCVLHKSSDFSSRQTAGIAGNDTMVGWRYHVSHSSFHTIQFSRWLVSMIYSSLVSPKHANLYPLRLTRAHSERPYWLTILGIHSTSKYILYISWILTLV